MSKTKKTIKLSPKKNSVRVKEKPVILITNDDGVSAPGIRNLVEAVKDLGKIIVVAPDKPQSGMGHAITIGSPLRLHPVHIFEGIEAFQCTGTPVDCVKLAVDKVLHRKPDLCLSGINHGANHSINVIYSGTMSAAVEAAIESIPSVGFSLEDVVDPTGAGDSFAGAMIGYLASKNSVNPSDIKKAVVYGNVLGSFAVEKYGLEGLLQIKKTDIIKRVKLYEKMIRF